MKKSEIRFRKRARYTYEVHRRRESTKRKESTFIVSHAIVYFFRFSAFCILFSTASIVILIIETWIKIRLVFKKMYGSNLIDEKEQFVIDFFRFSKIFLLLERID